ncbi:MAG: hypothetical protein M0C28_12595 [Candidatus Moduliflexus flocculans]|nr:hypothetical protein [Candidatus Moduliflexus flocculans]
MTMKPKAGRTFEVGKTYRLCIGMQNPQAVQMTSNNYECIVDFTFVFQENPEAGERIFKKKLKSRAAVGHNYARSLP